MTVTTGAATSPVTTIEQAARREHAAERNRAQAEAVWRQAWWQTTLALATPAETDRSAITATLDTAQRILGQSRGWLSRRRKTGMQFAKLRRGDIDQLPPRLAIAYCEAHGDPVRAVAALRDAEARGASLRDFAAELGIQPKSWLREGEQSQRPVTAEQLTARPPAEQAAVIRRALENPVVATQVLANYRLPAPAGPAPYRPVLEPSPRPEPLVPGAPHPHRPVVPPVADPGKADVLATLGDARSAVERAFRLAVALTASGDEEILAALIAVETEAGYFHKYLTGAMIDETVARIMTGTEH